MADFQAIQLINKHLPILVTGIGDPHTSFVKEFYRTEERKISIVHHQPKKPSGAENPDFEKLRIEVYGGKEPKWLDVSVDRFRKNRMTTIGFSIDKKQLEMLITQLQELNKLIHY